MEGAAIRTVVLLISEIPANAPIDEQDTLTQAAAVGEVLSNLGYLPVIVPFTLDLGATKHRLKALAPKFVVNLVESIKGRGRLIHLAPALLDDLALPYTGCGTAATLLTSDKLLVKRQLRAAGLPTPEWVCGSQVPSIAQFPGPWIVKSSHEHASLGLDQTAVTNHWDDLLELIAERRQRYGGDWFIERYIEGREFHVALLGPQSRPLVLPIAEMRFIDYPASKPRIVDYAAKWIKNSFEYRHTIRSFEHALVDAPLLRELSSIVRACWQLFELQGYAGVDVRIDTTGQCWILDVNSNPCIAPDSGFVAAAGEAGLSFAEVVRQLVQIIGDIGQPQLQIPLKMKNADEEKFLWAVDLDKQEVSDTLSWRDQPQSSDVEAVNEILRSTGFFTEAEIAIAMELIEERLGKGEKCGYFFIFVETQGQVLGYACFGPIHGTQSSWDLYWIAVHSMLQRRGIGSRILAQAEAAISVRGGWRIYVETSSRQQYLPTRVFYERRSYQRVAQLANFYAESDDKVIYVKTVGSKLGNFREPRKAVSNSRKALKCLNLKKLKFGLSQR